VCVCVCVCVCVLVCVCTSHDQSSHFRLTLELVKLLTFITCAAKAYHKWKLNNSCRRMQGAKVYHCFFSAHDFFFAYLVLLYTTIYIYVYIYIFHNILLDIYICQHTTGESVGVGALLLFPMYVYNSCNRNSCNRERRWRCAPPIPNLCIQQLQQKELQQRALVLVRSSYSYIASSHYYIYMSAY
jgi:hypothetical protein